MRTRRRRGVLRTIALILIPTFIIGPEAAWALHNEAMLHHVIAVAGVGDVGEHEVIITYDYDPNGNLISQTTEDYTSTATVDYAYDAENRLVYHDPGSVPGAVTTYAYDADGIRTAKTVGTEITEYLTDKNRPYAQVLEERTHAVDEDPLPAPTVRYTYGHDLISQTRGTATSYYHYDGQLSTRHLTDGTPGSPTFGAVTDWYTYDAFGVLLDSGYTGPAPTENNYRYTGEQYDPNVGFYYLRARYYAQDVGRFVSPDSFQGVLGDPQSLHKYTYAHNSPIDRTDPSGLFSLSLSNLGAIAIISTLAGIISAGIGAVQGYRSGKGIFVGMGVGFVTGFTGTFAALYLVPVFAAIGLGAFAPAAAFGFGSALAAFLEIMLLDGTDNLWTLDTLITVAVAFVAGAVLGRGGGAHYNKQEILRQIRDVPTIWKTLKKAATGNSGEPMKRRLAEAGLKQNAGEIVRLFGPEWRKLAWHILTDEVSGALKSSAIVPVANVLGRSIAELYSRFSS